MLKFMMKAHYKVSFLSLIWTMLVETLNELGRFLKNEAIDSLIEESFMTYD